LVGTPEGKRPPGRPRRRWEKNIKMDVREIGCGGMDWIDPAEDRDQWRAHVRLHRRARHNTALSCRCVMLLSAVL
jgi:hypothetical protein